MPKRILIKPAEGKATRSPLPPYDRIPATGYVREDSPAWRRLQRAGDVIISAEPAPARAAKASKV